MKDYIDAMYGKAEEKIKTYFLPEQKLELSPIEHIDLNKKPKGLLEAKVSEDITKINFWRVEKC